MALELAIGIAPSTLQPDQFPLESQKFADNGAWFASYARWIVFNFYNYNIRSVFPDTAYDYCFANGILENFSYYYGEQINKVFAYAQQLPSGENIPAPFIAGQQIRNFVDNMNGNIMQMAKPIGESISAKNLDYESVLDKEVKFNMARMAVQGQDLIQGLAERGINFSPTEKKYATPEEIDEDEESDIDEYEEAGIKITRSIYYEQDLINQFTSQDGLHQVVGGISGTIIEHEAGKVTHTHVPSFNCIYDYALGLQTDTVGKGVQQQSIQASTLANIPFYDGLMQFWQKKLQYSFELAKQFIKTGSYAMVVGDREVDILNVTKDTLSKDIGIYFTISDPINEENKKFLRDLLFNYSQSPDVLASQGISITDALDIAMAYTYESGRKELKWKLRKVVFVFYYIVNVSVFGCPHIPD